jgi:hypothetical protein
LLIRKLGYTGWKQTKDAGRRWIAEINNVIEFLPSAQSYNLIFFSSLVISIISIALAVILRHFTDD